MCLTFEFFEARENKAIALAAKGCVDLEEFRVKKRISWRKLEAAGLVAERMIRSTAEILKHDPTTIGRTYLTLHKKEDLIVIKKGMGDALLTLVRGRKN